MHANGKSTFASVSKWNSGKVNLPFKISSVQLQNCLSHFIFIRFQQFLVSKFTFGYAGCMQSGKVWKIWKSQRKSGKVRKNEKKLLMSRKSQGNSLSVNLRCLHFVIFWGSMLPKSFRFCSKHLHWVREKSVKSRRKVRQFS